MTSERISRTERAASVVVSALLMGFLFTSCFAYFLFMGFVGAVRLSGGHLHWPGSWFWGILIGVAVISSLFGGSLGYDDPPWGGVTFHAREHSYADQDHLSRTAWRDR